jgi:hypothetical protein
VKTSFSRGAQVVKSPEASGPFTEAALKALAALLSVGLLDLYDLRPGDPGESGGDDLVPYT